jgi:hypothetical protein
VHFSSIIETQTIVPENDFLNAELLEPHEKDPSPVEEDEDEAEDEDDGPEITEVQDSDSVVGDPEIQHQTPMVVEEVEDENDSEITSSALNQHERGEMLDREADRRGEDEEELEEDEGLIYPEEDEDAEYSEDDPHSPAREHEVIDLLDDDEEEEKKQPSASAPPEEPAPLPDFSQPQILVQEAVGPTDIIPPPVVPIRHGAAAEIFISPDVLPDSSGSANDDSTITTSMPRDDDAPATLEPRHFLDSPPMATEDGAVLSLCVPTQEDSVMEAPSVEMETTAFKTEADQMANVSTLDFVASQLEVPGSEVVEETIFGGEEQNQAGDNDMLQKLHQEPGFPVETVCTLIPSL